MLMLGKNLHQLHFLESGLLLQSDPAISLSKRSIFITRPALDKSFFFYHTKDTDTPVKPVLFLENLGSKTLSNKRLLKPESFAGDHSLTVSLNENTAKLNGDDQDE